MKISQIRTLSVERIGGRLAQLTPEVLDEVLEGINGSSVRNRIRREYRRQSTLTRPVHIDN